jgi:SAM-dependent methyltransferase
MSILSMNPHDLVRRGYDRIAERYLEARLRGIQQLPLVRELMRRVPPGRLVLDAGCGAGLPVTRYLSESYRVTGVDFSLAQLRIASKLAPLAHYVCQDLVNLGFASASMDAVCSFYAIIHIPRSSHAAILRAMHAVLRPGGYALLCLGAGDLEEDRGPYQGVPMYWSHFDADTYLAMLKQIGFSIHESIAVLDPIDGVGSHLFVLAQKVDP